MSGLKFIFKFPIGFPFGEMRKATDAFLIDENKMNGFI
jgi:hypothetical protein